MMTKFNTWGALLFILAIFAVGCKKDSDIDNNSGKGNDPDKESVLSIDLTEKAVLAGTGSFRVSITSTDSWTVSTDQTWLTIAPSGGAGNGNATITYEQNTGVERSATITFKSKDKVATTVVKQAAGSNNSDKDSVLSVSVNEKVILARAGSFQVTVTSSDSWTVSSNQTWVTIAPAGGDGDGTATISYEKNTGAERSATITFKSQNKEATTVVTQDAGVFSIDLTEKTVLAKAGSFQVTVTSTESWAVSSDQKWVTVTPAADTVSGSATITYEKNTGAERSAKVTFRSNDKEIVTMVKQAAGVFSIDLTEKAVLAEAGSFKVTVTSTDSWTVSSDQTWVTVTPAADTVSGTVTISYKQNIGAERSAKVTFRSNNKEIVTMVKQAAGVFSISLTEKAVLAEAGSFQVGVTSSDSWTVSPDQSWVTIAPASGSGNGTATITYEKNTGAERSATITFRSNNKEATTVVKQAAVEEKKDDDWTKTTSEIMYNLDGSELTRRETTYDAQGRETYYASYSEGILGSEFTNYVYSGKELTYDINSYTKGVLTYTSKLKIVYYDDNYKKATYSFYYKHDGSEYSRGETTYDALGRITSGISYLEGVLSSKSINYIYNGNIVTFDSEDYTKGVLTSIKKYKLIYADNNYEKITSQIIYNSDGSEYFRSETTYNAQGRITSNVTYWGGTESSRTETTYDAQGRETSSVSYYDGVIGTRYTNYIYNGKELTYDYENYSNGVYFATFKIKKVFY